VDSPRARNPLGARSWYTHRPLSGVSTLRLSGRQPHLTGNSHNLHPFTEDAALWRLQIQTGIDGVGDFHCASAICRQTRFPESFAPLAALLVYNTGKSNLKTGKVSLNTPEHQVEVDRHIIVHVVSLLSQCSGTLAQKRHKSSQGSSIEYPSIISSLHIFFPYYSSPRSTRLEGSLVPSNLTESYVEGRSSRIKLLSFQPKMSCTDIEARLCFGF
jgi:hypothetical protein